MSGAELPKPLPDGFLPDRYRDVRPLGLGGMGSVHTAYDTRVGRVVVVKCSTRAASARTSWRSAAGGSSRRRRRRRRSTTPT